MRIEAKRSNEGDVEFDLYEVPRSLFLLMAAGLKLLSLSKKWADSSRYTALLEGTKMEKVYNGISTNIERERLGNEN